MFQISWPVRSVFDKVKAIPGETIPDMATVASMPYVDASYTLQQDADGNYHLCKEYTVNPGTVTAEFNDFTEDYQLDSLPFECFTEQEPAEDNFVGCRPTRPS